MTNASREPFRPTLTTDADVTTMWRTLVQPLGWSSRRLYLLFVDPDRRPSPHLVEVDEMPESFTAEDAARFVEFLSHLVGEIGLDDAGSVALMLARPGSALLTERDRSTCRELYAAATGARLAIELLHVGTDTAIVPAPMDEVLPRSA